MEMDNVYFTVGSIEVKYIGGDCCKGGGRSICF